MSNRIKYNFIENFTKVEITSKIDTEIEKTEQINNSQNSFLFESTYYPKYSKTFINSLEKLQCEWRDAFKIGFEHKIEYNPCDSIGLVAPNSVSVVNELFSLCNFSRDNFIYKIERKGLQPFKFVGTIEEFITNRLDVTSIPKKKTLFELSKKAEKRIQLEFLCSKEGNESYLNLIKNRNNLIEILHEFGCKPSIFDLISHCEIIKPRYYSLTQKSGDNAEILLGIIENSVEEKKIYGHVSSFILDEFYKRNHNIPIEICFRKSNLNNSFSSKNLICFCTGTGLAPVIGLSNNKMNLNLELVYGYRNEIDNLLQYYEINENVVLASSAQKKYVYDFIEKIESIKDDCDVFICGNIKMQKAVFNAIKERFPEIIARKKVHFDSWL